MRLYERPGCHLCEQVAEELAVLARCYPVELERCNIESRPAWERRYGLVIPVVVVDRRYVLALRITRAALEQVLSRAAAGG